MVYHAVGLFHLILPDSPVVFTPIYILYAAYNRISHISRVYSYNELRVTSLVHETIYTE